MHIYITADHAGFTLKKKILRSLSRTYAIEDLSPTYNPADDYPKLARAAARLVAKNISSRGICICGSGVGMSIVANRIRGVRASIGESVATVRRGRAEDDINVLVLGSRIVTFKKAMAFVDTFLSTRFSKLSRHARRIKQIDSRN